MTALLERYRQLNDQIRHAAGAAGRDAESVRLIAVSKTHPAEAVAELLAAGHRQFGENRVIEAEAKYPDLKHRYPDLALHLIGPLQSNKARQAVALFDVIETLDRPKLAQILAAEMNRAQRFPRLLIEVNIAAEPQKAGIAAADTPGFLGFCQNLGLTIDGLMCIPPQGEDPAPHFRHLAELAGRLTLSTLSMGMSSDFPAAIAAGATQVRVGSLLFGQRA